MGKRVPQVNEAAQALQTDTSAKLAASQEKGLRSKSLKKPSSGDLIPPIPESQPDGKASGSEGGNQSLFDRIKSRLQKGDSRGSDKSAEEAAAEAFIKQEQHADHEHLYKDPPRKGDLTRAIRLEQGQDKLLVNQRKITDKVRKILIAIEAQDTYLKNIALKIISRKHQGIVIDLPKKEEDPVLGSSHEGPLGKLLGRKKDEKE